jgi:cell division protein ZapA
MAKVDIDIAGRRYSVACRDGEEGHLHALGAIVAAKAQDAAGALGTLSENRQLLLASLLLADELKEKRAAAPAAAPDSAPAEALEPDPAVAEALERLAVRMECLADRLESGAGNS